MNINPDTMPRARDSFDTPADYLTYWRAWTIYDELAHALNEWEATFIDSITSSARSSFTDKQRAKVNQIYERVELL